MSRPALANPSARRLPCLALLALALAGSGCLSPVQLEPEGYQYRAVIRWTTNGIPHILADDLPSAAYGQGYAFAKLNACVLADQIVKVRSERAMFLGRGDNDEHVRSDLVHEFLGVYRKAEEGLPGQPEEIQAMLAGYAAGYNDYIAAHAADLPCGEEPWLRPVSSVDLLAHYVELGMLASSRQAHDFIYDASVPASGAMLEREPSGRLEDLRRRPGSNGWGIGRDLSSNGHGMLVANPHFPWEGELKLFESHLRVPGQLDVYGAGLMGVPGILIGFNEEVAWTHTVSDGQRLTIYQLQLDPNDPTAYLFDGASRKMEAQTVETQVLEEDGSLSTVSRTFYRTHHGPLAALPGLALPGLGFAIRDANENNQALVAQFIGMNMARSMDEFQQVHDDVRGIPWVNTMSTSRDGRAWYIDSTPTPNLSPAAIALWLDARENDFFTIQLDNAGLVLLPGNDSMFDWVDEPGARDPGLVPIAKVPRLERSDFVFNANDSHWLTNPREPLTGYSPLHGFERTPRSPRTRMNAMMLLDEGNRWTGDGKFGLIELRQAILGDQGVMEILLRDEVVARCQGVTTARYEGQPVDITEACEVLADWDGLLETDSVGAVIWREFLGDFDPESHVEAGALFAEAFDPGPDGDATSAVYTPRGLAPAPEPSENPDDPPPDDRVLEALAGAVVRLQQARIPLDATLGEVQYTVRSGERIPIHGGGRNEGVANLVIYDDLNTTVQQPLPRGEVINPSTDLTTDGYVINYGTSFIMAMQFTDDGPEGFAFVTYGQSDDPRSPYHSDQTRRFSEKDWRRVLYTEKDIETDPELRVEVVFGLPRDEE